MFDDVMETLNEELDRLRLTPHAALATRISIDCAAGFGCHVVSRSEPKSESIWLCRWNSALEGRNIEMPAKISHVLSSAIHRIQSVHASHCGEPIDGISYRFDISGALVELRIWL